MNVIRLPVLIGMPGGQRLTRQAHSNLLRAFVAAARHQRFSKAAASLGVTNGLISKAIAKRDASIRTRVLHRRRISDVCVAELLYVRW